MIRPSFLFRFRKFIKDLKAYISYCINPKPTYGNKLMQRPTYDMAYARIKKEPIPTDRYESIPEGRRRRAIDRSNAYLELRSMAKRYKFNKKWDKQELNRTMKDSFRNLF